MGLGKPLGVRNLSTGPVWKGFELRKVGALLGLRIELIERCPSQYGGTIE